MTAFHGYYVVPATLALNLVALGTFYSSATFVIPLEESFPEAGRGLIDFLPSLYLSVALFASLSAGFLQDFLLENGSTIRPVFAMGGVCIGAGTFMSSIGATFTQVLLGAVLTGIGIGLTGLSAAGVCVQWFVKNRGTMLLLAMTGSGLGNYSYSVVNHSLMEYFAAGSCVEDEPCEAWRPTMRVVGLFSMTLAIVASSVMRLPEPDEVEDYEGRDEEHDEEGDAMDKLIDKMYGSMAVSPSKSRGKGTDQLGSVGVSTRRNRRNSSIAVFASFERERHQASILRTSGSRRRSTIYELEALAMLPVNYLASQSTILVAPDTPTPGLPFLSLKEVIFTRTTILMLVWALVGSFAFTNFFVHVPSFAAAVGLSSADGARAMSMTGLGILLGNMTLGMVVDMVGPVKSFRFTMTSLVVIMFAWPYCTTPASLMTVAFIYGFNATTQMSVPLIILADAFGETSPDSILTLVGILNVCKFPGYLFGPVMVGTLFEAYGNYTVGSIVTGTTFLIANVCLFFLPSSKDQRTILMERHEKLKDGAARVLF
jgi:MFS family permease